MHLPSAFIFCSLYLLLPSADAHAFDRAFVAAFRVLDRNGDGLISKAEFALALPLLGFDASSRPLCDAIFESMVSVMNFSHSCDPISG